MKKLLAVTLILSLALSMAGCCCVNIPKDILEKYFEKEPDNIVVPSESEPLETEPAAPADEPCCTPGSCTCCASCACGCQ